MALLLLADGVSNLLLVNGTDALALAAETAQGAGSITATSSVTATGQKDGKGTSSLSATTALTATGAAGRAGTATITATTAATGTGSAARVGTGTITQPTALTGDGGHGAASPGGVNATSSLTGSGRKDTGGAGAATTTSTITASGVVAGGAAVTTRPRGGTWDAHRLFPVEVKHAAGGGRIYTRATLTGRGFCQRYSHDPEILVAIYTISAAGYSPSLRQLRRRQAEEDRLLLEGVFG